MNQESNNTYKMQASNIYFPVPVSVSSSLPFLSTKTSTFTAKTTLILFPGKQSSISKIKAASDGPQVDYNSMQSSVFPAEACETLGGVACDVEMFPETKLKHQPTSKSNTTQTTLIDREYLEYDNNPKTVFIAEACDDLGGEFCEPAYQTAGDN